MLFHNDPHYYPYSSKRTTTYARNGVVATSQPLAAQAGLDILKKGGNAVDAAIAAAAALTVVEPTSNGIGGDAFALVWVKNQLHGLNASGPAPTNISIESLKKRGVEQIPPFGFVPVTIPGAPAGWAELSEKFGCLPFKELFESAIEYAEEGYPLSPVLAHFWEKGALTYKEQLNGEEYKNWFETFTPHGRVPKAGEMWNSPCHADTLKKIAESKARDFYEGELAEQIVQFSKQYNGYIEKSDLENYRPEWVDPIHVSYKGYNVWEIPPNGQGTIALQALNIIEHLNLKGRDDEKTLHSKIEALKLAFSDGLQYITDPSDMKVAAEALLSKDYAFQRSRKIGETALHPEPGEPPKGGTVYLAAADKEGNMVSFIQSNYMGFGSGLVVPETGISLQNRGHHFSMDPNHANVIRGGKKTYHTIIPGFLTKEKEAIGPFGVMGGFMQPQGHMQVIMNSIDFGLNPQAALDAPRWQWLKDKKIMMEHSFHPSIAQKLEKRGHKVEIAHSSGAFGRGQMIWRNSETGVYAAGTEARTDGTISAW
ncbi:gamma-glutamyltransferase family protein [Alteribacillus sp. JSM 102045]|uniref:gamma-glutamyltransferase family protein n=1 Tax=Alteribacillus sp. JSM 102045 TaxID=1562101 RepID=UPI0035BF1213